MQVNIKRTHPDATIPVYATSGAGGFDITVAEYEGGDVYNTGLAFEIPEGHVLKIYGRSGHAFKHGMRLANCVAIIDSDYRGTVKIKLAYDGWTTHVVEKGERIAQGIIVPIPFVEFNEVSELNDTERGKGGFGSTGR